MRAAWWKRRLDEGMHQLFIVGIESLPVVALSLLFITVMLITEFSYHVKLVLRQDSLVPAFSTILMVRELGPVVTSLLLASRIGAGIAAEVGAMRISDQIDALRLLGVHPVLYLVLPRWLACVIGVTALSVVALGIGIAGGASIAAVSLGYGVQEYFNTMFTFTRYHDIWGCLLKSAVFGTIIPLVACYHGFRCASGSQGVGNAATRAVVHGSVLIIAMDFVLTYWLRAI